MLVDISPLLRYSYPMPRTARIDIPGLLQHVMARGIEKSDIFLEDDDKTLFVDISVNL